MLPWRLDADHDEVLAVEERIAANFAKQRPNIEVAPKDRVVGAIGKSSGLPFLWPGTRGPTRVQYDDLVTNTRRLPDQGVALVGQEQAVKVSKEDAPYDLVKDRNMRRICSYQRHGWNSDSKRLQSGGALIEGESPSRQVAGEGSAGTRAEIEEACTWQLIEQKLDLA